MKRPYFEIANLEIPKIVAHLGHGLNVLDVGCGSGVHGAELKRFHGHRVFGVDLSVESIQKARTRLATAYVGDVTRPEEYPFSAGERFDLILFSDILEHLTDPVGVLGRHLFLLKPGGQMIVSLPNIAIWNVRLSLLFGSFQYQETGTLDKTHMRFFTWSTMREMFGQLGLEVTKRRITPGIARPCVPLVKKLYGNAGGAGRESDSSSIMDSAPYRFYSRFLYPIEALLCRLWPGLLAFQFVSLCRPVGGTLDIRSANGDGENLESPVLAGGEASSRHSDRLIPS
jgi:SAM-dependent methyltransferase